MVWLGQRRYIEILHFNNLAIDSYDGVKNIHYEGSLEDVGMAPAIVVTLRSSHSCFITCYGHAIPTSLNV